MFRDVISREDTLSDWERKREQVRSRILATVGTGPAFPDKTEHTVLGTEDIRGFRAEKIRFELLPGFPTHGSLIRQDAPLSPAVLCIHETDYEDAHRSVMLPESKPDVNYALELAARGYTVLALDLPGYGEGNSGLTYAEMTAKIYSTFPEWSVDGMMLAVNRKGVDILSSLGTESIGCIGHSLGGRAALYLAAFEERIDAAVMSTGISPNMTNLYRNLPSDTSFSRKLDEGFLKNHVPAFEYQELIAMAAPRFQLFLEPWNDLYNPDIGAVFRCFEKARSVYGLYGKPGNLHLLCHGDGHTTRKELREFSYSMLDRILKKTV